jgi:hypothetical protein
MDLSDLSLMVGEIRQDQREMKELLAAHLAKQEELDARLAEVERFQKKQKTIASVIAALATGLWTVLPFRWFK